MERRYRGATGEVLGRYRGGTGELYRPQRAHSCSVEKEKTANGPEATAPMVPATIRAEPMTIWRLTWLGLGSGLGLGLGLGQGNSRFKVRGGVRARVRVVGSGLGVAILRRTTALVT